MCGVRRAVPTVLPRTFEKAFVCRFLLSLAGPDRTVSRTNQNYKLLDSGWEIGNLDTRTVQYQRTKAATRKEALGYQIKVEGVDLARTRLCG